MGYRYYSATSAEELTAALSEFSKPSDKPMFLEVYTKMEADAVNTRKMYNEIKQGVQAGSSVKGFAKGIVKSILRKNNG